LAARCSPLGLLLTHPANRGIADLHADELDNGLLLRGYV
jgi:hypothetical protein